MRLIVLLCSLAATGDAAVKWLRIAQREHYIAGSVTRFALRWWRLSTLGPALLAVAVVAAGAAAAVPLAGLVCLAIAAVAPLGLSLRGRTSKLRWTSRLRRATAAFGVLALIVAALGFFAHAAPLLALLPVLAPLVVDAALAVMRPIEYRLVTPFVIRATERLRKVRPRVIAITGSYGKTTTKNYVAHLVNPTFPTLATPASYNNRVGLARAINEHLAPGTDVFVAEIGTYGPGEIRDACAWLEPDVAAITAIGPVHLERMKSLDTIVTAKLEITELARTSILNIDVPGIAAARTGIEAAGRETVGTSSVAEKDADVAVLGDAADKVLWVNGVETARFTSDGENGNIAIAAAAAAAVGVPWPDISKRLSDLPASSHRQTTLTTDEGVLVIDDTYNSNPTGAAAALRKLRRLDASRRAVVTPGMVELGTQQVALNRAFAEQVSGEADFLVVVGRTNRAALVAGATGGPATVVQLATRADAVAWVRASLHNGDAVLYENDLPDHYP